MFNIIIMKKYIFLLLILSPFFSLQAQDSNFPKAWEGIWKGELTAYTANNTIKMKIPMELHILPIDSTKWTWKIVYSFKDKPKDERNYELIIKEKAKGHYAIDEKDGIILDSYYIHDTFFSSFAVEGTEIISKDHLEGKNLVYEMIEKKTKEIAVTGGTSKDVLPVSSFEVTGYYKAVLKRVKK